MKIICLCATAVYAAAIGDRLKQDAGTSSLSAITTTVSVTPTPPAAVAQYREYEGHRYPDRHYYGEEGEGEEEDDDDDDDEAEEQEEEEEDEDELIEEEEDVGIFDDGDDDDDDETLEKRDLSKLFEGGSGLGDFGGIGGGNDDYVGGKGDDDDEDDSDGDDGEDDDEDDGDDDNDDDGDDGDGDESDESDDDDDGGGGDDDDDDSEDNEDDDGDDEDESDDEDEKDDNDEDEDDDDHSHGEDEGEDDSDDYNYANYHVIPASGAESVVRKRDVNATSELDESENENEFLEADDPSEPEENIDFSDNEESDDSMLGPILDGEGIPFIDIPQEGAEELGKIDMWDTFYEAWGEPDEFSTRGYDKSLEINCWNSRQGPLADPNACRVLVDTVISNDYTMDSELEYVNAEEVGNCTVATSGRFSGDDEAFRYVVLAVSEHCPAGGVGVYRDTLGRVMTTSLVGRDQKSSAWVSQGTGRRYNLETVKFRCWGHMEEPVAEKGACRQLIDIARGGGATMHAAEDIGGCSLTTQGNFVEADAPYMYMLSEMGSCRFGGMATFSDKYGQNMRVFLSRKTRASPEKKEPPKKHGRPWLRWRSS